MAGQPHLFQLQISMVEDILRNHLHSHLMWIKQCHKPPMTGNGNHTNYKNCAGWGRGLFLFYHVLPTLFQIPKMLRLWILWSRPMVLSSQKAAHSRLSPARKQGFTQQSSSRQPEARRAPSATAMISGESP